MKLNHAHHWCIIVAQPNREDEGDGGLEFVGGAGCRRRRCGWWSESAATRDGAARCSTRAAVPVEVRRRDGVGLRAAAI